MPPPRNEFDDFCDFFIDIFPKWDDVRCTEDDVRWLLDRDLTIRTDEMIPWRSYNGKQHWFVQCQTKQDAYEARRIRPRDYEILPLCPSAADCLKSVWAVDRFRENAFRRVDKERMRRESPSPAKSKSDRPEPSIDASISSEKLNDNGKRPISQVDCPNEKDASPKKPTPPVEQEILKLKFELVNVKQRCAEEVEELKKRNDALSEKVKKLKSRRTSDTPTKLKADRVVVSLPHLAVDIPTQRTSPADQPKQESVPLTSMEMLEIAELRSQLSKLQQLRAQETDSLKKERDVLAEQMKEHQASIPKLAQPQPTTSRISDMPLTPISDNIRSISPTASCPMEGLETAKLEGRLSSAEQRGSLEVDALKKQNDALSREIKDLQDAAKQMVPARALAVLEEELDSLKKLRTEDFIKHQDYTDELSSTVKLREMEIESFRKLLTAPRSEVSMMTDPNPSETRHPKADFNMETDPEPVVGPILAEMELQLEAERILRREAERERDANVLALAAAEASNECFRDARDALKKAVSLALGQRQASRQVLGSQSRLEVK